MKHKQVILIMVFIFTAQVIYAGCGSCKVHNTKKPTPEQMENLVSTISEDGQVNGQVHASCGMCNFGAESNDCSLFIKIGENSYPVSGTSIDDHGDSHAKDGFCNAIRTANVSGVIKEGVFHAESFELK